MSAKIGCDARVSDGMFRSRACTRAASVVRDGSHYCKQHDPVAKEARRDATQSAWRAEWNVKMARRRIEMAAPDLLAACELVAASSMRNEAYDACIAAIAKAKAAK